MNDITVVISGMILFLSPVAYIPNGSEKIHAAVAVNATSPTSSYGVDIPKHYAALVFANNDLSAPNDPANRLTADDVPNKTRLDLHGDRVQFGLFDGRSRTCHAIADNPSIIDATTSHSFGDIPRMKDLVGKLDLDPDTYPVNGIFSGVTPKKVAAWFEVPLGRLRGIHSESLQDDEAVFRPTNRNVLLVPAVEWRLPEGSVDCLAVTSFDNTSRVDIPFKPGRVSVTYQNRADMTSGEMVPGIGYDFEVLYGLFTTKPQIPPLPYSVTSPMHANTPVSVTTGINCGPATVPGGG
jgi:hypothetical protein